MPGLVFKWFPLCEFSLFDTPQAQFSGSLGSWSQCSHSKGSGLDLKWIFCATINQFRKMIYSFRSAATASSASIAISPGNPTWPAGRQAEAPFSTFLLLAFQSLHVFLTNIHLSRGFTGGSVKETWVMSSHLGRSHRC